jgi:hypothetical protein
MDAPAVARVDLEVPVRLHGGELLVDVLLLWHSDHPGSPSSPFSHTCIPTKQLTMPFTSGR